MREKIISYLELHTLFVNKMALGDARSGRVKSCRLCWWWGDGDKEGTGMRNFM